MRKLNLTKMIFVLTNQLLAFFYCIFGRKQTHFSSMDICSILLANTAHLGDVIISTSLLPIIKKYYPNVEIGFIVGAWAKPVVVNHPLIDEVYCFDHFCMNRTNKGLLSKLFSHLSSRKKVLLAINKKKYDLAIDLFPFRFSAVSLFWQAKIPKIIAYKNVNFSFMISYGLFRKNINTNIANHMFDLIRLALPLIPEDERENLQPVISRDPNVKIRNFLPATKNTHGYIVMHLLGSSHSREWIIDKWIALKEALLAEGFTLVYSGADNDMENKIKCVIGNSTNCVNLLNKLSWFEFVELVFHCQGIVSIDTSAIHVAAAANVPCVVLGHGMNYYEQFRPLSKKSIKLVNRRPCFPCLRHDKGCKKMYCLKKIAVTDVLKALIDLQVVNRSIIYDR